MLIQQIDILNSQSTHTLLYGLAQKLARAAGCQIGFQAEFGGEENLASFACAGEPFANEGFRVGVGSCAAWEQSWGVQLG